MNIFSFLNKSINKVLSFLKIRGWLNRVSRFNNRHIIPRLIGLMQYIFPVQKGKVASFSNGNITNIQYKMLRQELDRYDGWKRLVRFNTMVERGPITQFFKIPYHMVTSEVVMFEDGCKLAKYIKRDKSKRIFIQVWHATGAYKKFGLAMAEAGVEGIDSAKEIASTHNYDYFIDPGEKFRANYYQAFGPGCKAMDGIMNPRVDLLFDKSYVDLKKKNLYNIYPEFVGKKLLLYTPTFRGFTWEPKKLAFGIVVYKPKKNGRKDTSNFMDFDKVLDNLDKDWILILKKHPSMRNAKYNGVSERNKDRFYDLSANVNNLMQISDLMVCDYSSTFFEMSMLGKPIVFFAPDVDKYKNDRGFFYNFEDFVPGPICRDEKTMCEAINNLMLNENPGEQAQQFAAKYFGEIPRNNSEKFADFIANYVNRNGVVVKKVREREPFWAKDLEMSDEDRKLWVETAQQKYANRIKKIEEINCAE